MARPTARTRGSADRDADMSPPFGLNFYPGYARRSIDRKACGGLPLDALSVRAPDVFVHLELHANLELVLEHPRDELFRRERSEDARREDRAHLLVEPVLANRILHPLVVAATREHELDLVVRAEMLEVRPPVTMAFSRS